LKEIQQKEDSEEDSEKAKHNFVEKAKSFSISKGRGFIKNSKKSVYVVIPATPCSS